MLSVVFAGLLSAATVPLATFDGEANHTWSVENDPVMGGQSFSNFTVITDEAAGKTVGEWIGQCRIVPSLGAPGFTIALTESPALSTFPSAADEDGLLVTMRNVAGNITKFKAAFCDTKTNPYRCQFGTYKAAFMMPHTNGLHTVRGRVLRPAVTAARQMIARTARCCPHPRSPLVAAHPCSGVHPVERLFGQVGPCHRRANVGRPADGHVARLDLAGSAVGRGRRGRFPCVGRGHPRRQEARRPLGRRGPVRA